MPCRVCYAAAVLYSTCPSICLRFTHRIHDIATETHQLIMGGGLGQGWACGAAQSVRGNYTFFGGDKCDGFGKNASVYHVYPGVSHTCIKGLLD